ncbi:MAG: hypothetical protein Q9221_003196 [Calogaya cf. arnoldii]
MPPSARQRGTPSTARTSTTTARQPSNAANALPAYQPLTHPLNPTAQHALHNLPTTHPLNDLKQRLSTASNHLNEVTGDLNDQYQVKKAEFDKQKSQKAARAKELESSQGADNDDEDGDRPMQDAWTEVENLTGKMEARTRLVIDIQARVENTETVLKELNANVTNGRTSTQSTLGASQFRTQTQRQRRRHRPGHDEDDSEDDHDDNDAAPEDAPTPALTVFKTKLSTASSNYNSLSMSDRYTSHNTYIGFRQIVHDSRHPNDDTPMPHHSTWFPTDNQPSTTAPQPNRRNNKRPKPTPPPSEDDEIQIAREKRSIRCPITLLPLSNPLTSTRCPHSFESEAILNMLSASPLRAHNSSNDQNNKPTLSTLPRDKTAVNALKCPECEVLLTKETLRMDAALVRKIKKIAEVERRQQNGDDEDDDNEAGGDGRDKIEEVTSSPVLSRGKKGPQSVKRERMSQMQMASQRQREREREVSMVPDSQVVDLGDGEEDEEVDVDLGSGEDVDDGDED